MPVQLICASHSPLMTTDVEETEQNVHADFFGELDSCAKALHAFNPDLVVVFGPDHFNGFFYELMPAFCIGTAAEATKDWHFPGGMLRVPRELALACIGRGVHVLVEKPIASSVDEGRAIIAAARHAGVITASQEQSAEQPKRSLLARIFGSGKDLDEQSELPAPKEASKRVRAPMALASLSPPKLAAKLEAKRVAVVPIVPLPAARPLRVHWTSVECDGIRKYSMLEDIVTADMGPASPGGLGAGEGGGVLEVQSRDVAAVRRERIIGPLRVSGERQRRERQCHDRDHEVVGRDDERDAGDRGVELGVDLRQAEHHDRRVGEGELHRRRHQRRARAPASRRLHGGSLAAPRRPRRAAGRAQPAARSLTGRASPCTTACPSPGCRSGR